MLHYRNVKRMVDTLGVYMHYHRNLPLLRYEQQSKKYGMRYMKAIQRLLSTHGTKLTGKIRTLPSLGQVSARLSQTI